MYRFAIIFLVIGCVNSEEFTLFEARNDVSETRCSTGLLANIDVVVFKGKINLTADSGTSTANFEIKNSLNNTLQYICDIRIPSDCSGNSTPKCSCKKIENTIFLIDFNVSASLRFNRAFIHGSLYKSNHGIIQRTVSFPEVYETNNTTGLLVINDKEISTQCNVCETQVNDLHLTVNFSCKSLASPCVIQLLLINDSLTAVNSTNEIYFKKILKPPVTLHLQIKYAACRMDGQFKTIKCQIKMINRSSETKKECDEIITAISSTLGIIIFFLLLLLILANFRKKNKFWRWCASCHKPKRLNQTSGDIDFTEDKPSLRRKSCESVVDGHRKRNSTSTHSGQCTSLLMEESTQKHGSEVIEVLLCENGVLDLQRNNDECPKKENHGYFIDVNDFDKHHLPVGFQDDNFKKIILSMADLTVLVTVSVGTDVNSSRNLKIGNGWLVLVSKFKESEKKICCCRECLLSTTPSKQYAKVVIYTSTLVVRNEKEAMLTTCRLFYDKANSPIINLKDCYKLSVDEDLEKTKLHYMTCCPKTIKRLKVASKKWNDLYPKINEEYKEKSQNYKSVILVSHIHGLHKRISIGRYLDIEIDNRDTSYIYEAPTCFGSTGAYVYIVSRGKRGFLSQHIHHGVNENGTKFTGKGTDYND